MPKKVASLRGIGYFPLKIKETRMATIMPQSELLRKAIQYIVEIRSETKKPATDIIDEAGMRFNLSPKDTGFLRDFFAKNPEFSE